MQPLSKLFPSLVENYWDIPEVRDGIVRIAWNHCVGEKIRKISEPVKFESGNLRVKVSHPQWQSTLESMKREIISRMNEYIRKDLVKGIEFIH